MTAVKSNNASMKQFYSPTSCILLCHNCVKFHGSHHSRALCLMRKLRPPLLMLGQSPCWQRKVKVEVTVVKVGSMSRNGQDLSLFCQGRVKIEIAAVKVVEVGSMPSPLFSRWGQGRSRCCQDRTMVSVMVVKARKGRQRQQGPVGHSTEDCEKVCLLI